jgi:hypothetical protein
MSGKCYASHIETSLDAAAINIKKKRPGKRKEPESDPES